MPNIVKASAIPTKMNTKDIASITGKQHGHVLRDTRVMLVTLFANDHVDRVIPADKVSQRGQFIQDNIDNLFKGAFRDDPDLDHQENRGFTLNWDKRSYLSSVDLDRNLTLTQVSGYDIVLRNRVVTRLDEVERKLAAQPKIAYATGKSDTLTADEQIQLRDMLTDAAEALPKDSRGAFMKRGWSKLMSHFKVTYRKIPRSEFSEALAIASRHIAEYSAPALPAPSATDQALLQAMDCMQVMASSVADLTSTVMQITRGAHSPPKKQKASSANCQPSPEICMAPTTQNS